MESKRPNHRPNKPLTTNQELTDNFLSPFKTTVLPIAFRLIE